MRRRRLLTHDTRADDTPLLADHGGHVHSGHLRVGLTFVHRRDAYHALRRRMLVSALALDVLCMAVFLTSNELQWNGATFLRTPTSDALAIGINMMSATHLLLIIVGMASRVSFHRFKLQFHVDQQRRARHQSSVRVGVGEALSSWLSTHAARWVLPALELLLVIPQPLPYIDPFTSLALGLVLFPRLFWIAALCYREFSAFSSKNQLAIVRPLVSRAQRKHYVNLPFKSLVFIYPLQFLSFLLLVGALSFGYSLYVVERIAQPSLFNFPDSVYLSTQIIITGWAADTFELVNPITRLGRAICLGCVIFGLFVFFWLLALITEWLVPTAPEKEVIVGVQESRMEDDVRVAAATVIQRWWRLERASPATSRQALRRFQWARNTFIHARRIVLTFADRFNRDGGGHDDGSEATAALAREVRDLKQQIQELTALMKQRIQ